MDDMYHIRVSWQAVVFVISLLIFPAAYAVAKDFTGYGDQDLRIIAWSVMAVDAIACLSALLSRICAARNRSTVLKQLAMGFGTEAAAAILIFISRNYGTYSMFGDKWYLVPSGLMVLGLFLICKAMTQ